MSNIIRKTTVIATIFFLPMCAYPPEQFFLTEPTRALAFLETNHQIALPQTVEQFKQVSLNHVSPNLICFTQLRNDGVSDEVALLTSIARRFARADLRLSLVDSVKSPELSHQLRKLFLQQADPDVNPTYIFIYKAEVLLPALFGRHDEKEIIQFVQERLANYGLPHTETLFQEVAFRVKQFGWWVSSVIGSFWR